MELSDEELEKVAGVEKAKIMTTTMRVPLLS